MAREAYAILPRTTRNEGMKKVKLAVILIVSVAALVVVLQNTEATPARILFWTVPVSRSLVLTLIFVLVFVLGFLVASNLLRKKRGKA